MSKEKGVQKQPEALRIILDIGDGPGLLNLSNADVAEQAGYSYCSGLDSVIKKLKTVIETGKPWSPRGGVAGGKHPAILTAAYVKEKAGAWLDSRVSDRVKDAKDMAWEALQLTHNSREDYEKYKEASRYKTCIAKGLDEDGVEWFCDQAVTHSSKVKPETYDYLPAARDSEVKTKPIMNICSKHSQDEARHSHWRGVQQLGGVPYEVEVINAYMAKGSCFDERTGRETIFHEDIKDIKCVGLAPEKVYGFEFICEGIKEDGNICGTVAKASQWRMLVDSGRHPCPNCYPPESGNYSRKSFDSYYPNPEEAWEDDPIPLYVIDSQLEEIVKLGIGRKSRTEGRIRDALPRRWAYSVEQIALEYFNYQEHWVLADKMYPISNRGLDTQKWGNTETFYAESEIEVKIFRALVKFLVDHADMKDFCNEYIAYRAGEGERPDWIFEDLEDREEYIREEIRRVTGFEQAA